MVQKIIQRGNDAQQPLLQLGFRLNDKLIGTGSYAKVK